MRDIAAERISRFHAGFFEDPDGEYEIVSSLTKNILHYHAEVSEEEEVSSVRTVAPTITSSSDDVLFYIQAFWSVLALATIVLLSYRWMISSKSEAVGSKKVESECTGKSIPKEVVFKSQPHGQETSEADHPVQNLFNQFEKAEDCTTVEKKGGVNGQEGSESPVEKHHHHESVETIMYKQEPEEIMVPKDMHSTPIRAKPPQPRFRGQPHPPPTRQRSSSPPALAAESLPNCPQSLPARPRRDSQKDQQCCAQSMPSSPTSIASMNETELCPKSSPTPVNFDASMEVIDHHSAVQQTPQKMAQTFCQSVEIIEQVIVRSSVKVDSSRVATELAILLHTSQIKERHLQQKMCFEARRQSSLTLEKYEDNLKQIPKLRAQCLNSIWSAVNYSLWVVLLLEAARHGSGLLNQLELISVEYFFEKLLEMACDCGEDTYPENMESQSSSFMSTITNPFFPSWEKDSATFSSLRMLAHYFPCVLGYLSIGVILMLTHAALRYMHFPAFLHQVFNIGGLVLYLAVRPWAWMVVTDNLERYLFFAIVQVTVTVASFSLAIWWGSHTSGYISERQRQAQNSQDPEMMPCYGRSKLAHFDTMALTFSLAPPVVMGLLVLGVKP